ncbi:PREDICTED: uncharacterized protein LOC107170134 [Diuraphis noxia]|uniref:uncharacterized protein LOC107170134 n=1 Tax=Diuraphis noxia TaxID=143948 RepID=UPI0007639E1A|nr:PREDICTED: uncharacterized protein LOC107170134 [Diuraphis noxia]
MCRASYRQHPKMGPMPKNHSNSYANRLNDLKQALKPYRDNNANCLRLITRSARVNLNKHWKSLENLFTAGHDRRAGDVKERAQNAANEMLENGENERPAATRSNPTADAVDKFRHLRMDDR